MKKFIILLMSIVLLFSVFAMSACESGDTGEVSTSSETSSEEESSSGKVSRNFGGGSSSIDTESNGNGTLPTTSTTSGENGNTSVPEISFSGDSFYAPETPVPDGTSANAAMLIMQIGFIEVTPSNYETIEATIKEAEDFYATLTPSEKAEVINYQHLVAAREALNKIKAAGSLAKFEQLMSTLPEPSGLKNANVDAVYQAKELLDSNEAYFQANCASFTSYKTKLTDCYNTVVAAIVEKTYIAQDAKSINDAKTTDTTVGDGIVDSYELTNKKSRKDKTDGFFVRTSTDGSSSSAINYSDKLNANVSLTRLSKGEISFTAPCSGTVTFYAKMDNKVYSIYLDGEKIASMTSSSGANVLTAELPNAGAVRVIRDDSAAEGAFYAIKFSYPNLG